MGLESSLSIDIGAMDSQVLVIGGKKKFIKRARKIGGNFLRIIEPVFFGEFFKYLPNNYHRKFPKNQRELLEKEFKTWNLWKKEGIPTLNLQNFSGDEIEWGYLEGSRSLRQSLNFCQDEKTFLNFLELYQKIRSLAKTKNNSDYLHSDPHLGNFLISKEKEIYPIDPGCLLKEELGINELTFSLLKQTLCSIIFLNTDISSKKNYVSSFNQSLNKSEKERFLQEFNKNKTIPILPRVYFKLREEFVSRVKKREKIDPFLELKDFQDKYETHFKDIFEN